MAAISTRDMTEYLNQVMKTESTLFGLKEARRTAEEAAEREKTSHMPEQPAIKEPQDRSDSILWPREPVYVRELEWDRMVILITAFLAIGGIGLILFSVGFTIVGIVLFALVAILAILVVVTFVLRAKNAKRRAQFDDEVEEYEKQVREAKESFEREKFLYDQSMARAKEQYDSDRAAKQSYFESADAAVAQFDQPMNQTKSILSQLYATDWLFPKYRNLISVSTMYEYFATGRVTELEGVNGAYNLYETELRQNMISNRMDTILSHMSDTIQNQYTLYKELQRTTEMLPGIAEDVQEIYQRTQITPDKTQVIVMTPHINACCAQAAEQNEEALQYLATIPG